MTWGGYDPWYVYEIAPENEVPHQRRNLRNAVAFSPTDELWWREYGAAMDAFHDKMRQLDPRQEK